MTDFDKFYKTKHHKNSGVYARQMELPSGYYAEAHIHDFDHMSILAKGKVEVLVEGVPSIYTAPAVLCIEAGKEHKIVAIEDVVWFCIHPNEDYKVEEIKTRRDV